MHEFKYASADERKRALEKEPKANVLEARNYVFLAALAHKLANDNGFPVPAWAMKDKYVMPNPYYPWGENDPDIVEAWVKTTPFEFSSRNLFYGSKFQ